MVYETNRISEREWQAEEGITTVQVRECEIMPDGNDTSTLLEEKEQVITEPFNTRDIRIESKSGNMNTLLARLRNNEIDLAPDFQRQAGIWTDQNQSRLIESLMLRIPIPAFYFDGTDTERWLVVDGLQRKRKYGKRMLMYHMNRSNGEQESIYQKSRGW